MSLDRGSPRGVRSLMSVRGKVRVNHAAWVMRSAVVTRVRMQRRRHERAKRHGRDENERKHAPGHGAILGQAGGGVKHCPVPPGHYNG